MKVWGPARTELGTQGSAKGLTTHYATGLCQTNMYMDWIKIRNKFSILDFQHVKAKYFQYIFTNLLAKCPGIMHCIYNYYSGILKSSAINVNPDQVAPKGAV